MSKTEYLLFGGLILTVFIVLIFGKDFESTPRKDITKSRIDLITLDNGVECAVVKGKYSDNAISCNWNKK